MLTELHAWWLIGDRKNKVRGSLSHNVIEVASGGPRGTLKSWKLKLNAKVNYALAA
jgi:hypothetical protein